MSRVIFTSKDIRGIVEEIFNGNLRLTKLKPNVVYANPNSEMVALYDEDTEDTSSVDLAKYLNLTFYTWKNRLVEVPRVINTEISAYEAWIESLNESTTDSYGLVEILAEENVQSQDIDGGNITAQITFLVQTNKIENLEYYVSKLKNIYLGNPQDIQDVSSDHITAFIGLGALTYDTEPQTTPLGETIIASVKFSFNYIKNASTSADVHIKMLINPSNTEISFDNIAELPYSKLTWQQIPSAYPVPKAVNPSETGFLVQTISTVKNFTFFDFPNNPTVQSFNQLLWKLGASTINGVNTTPYEVNIPVIIQVTTNGNTYKYQDVITQMQKVITNGDFTINSLSLKGNAR